jgi:hypothetical protein
MGVLSRMKRDVAVDNATAAPTAMDVETTMALTATDGRERLRAIEGSLTQGRAVHVEIEAQLDRLVRIIRDADAADAALQEAVDADGGVALAAFAGGNASDAPIAKLIATKETTAKAAAVAKVALPKAHAMLTATEAELSRLEEEKKDAVLAYLTSRANPEASECRRIFEELCKSHDRLTGISVALAVEGTSGQLLSEYLTMEIPRFARVDMPPVADPNFLDYMPVKRFVSQFTVERTTNDWRRARERLSENVDAELNDLIGPQVEED